MRINPDGATMEQCLVSAKLALSALQEIDMKAKEAAAKALLPKYNQHWRHYARADGQGEFVETHDPELDASDFKWRLRMTCLEVTGADSYTLFYDDDLMFAGHAVVITSFDGLLFSDVHAEIFG